MLLGAGVLLSVIGLHELFASPDDPSHRRQYHSNDYRSLQKQCVELKIDDPAIRCNVKKSKLLQLLASNDVDYSSSGKYIIYGTEWCKYCQLAKLLLSDNLVDFEYHDIPTMSTDQKKWMNRSKPKDWKTVPIIFSPNQQFLGGYSELRLLFQDTVDQDLESIIDPTIFLKTENIMSNDDLEELIWKFEPSDENFRKMLDKLPLLSTDYELFKGIYIYSWGWLLYLQYLLDDDIMCAWMNNNVNQAGITYMERWDLRVNENGVLSTQFDKALFSVESWVLDSIDDCSKKARFVVGILGLGFTDRWSANLNWGYHANALIFDTENNMLTRFEPHGSVTSSYNVKMLDNKIEEWLEKNQKSLPHTKSKKKWEYHKPKDFCPMTGPQSREHWSYVEEAFKIIDGIKERANDETYGFCAAWSLIYIHARITSPNLSDMQVVDSLLRQTDQELSYFVRQYSEFIVNRLNPDWVSDKFNYENGSYVRTIEGSKGIVLYSFYNENEHGYNQYWSVVWLTECFDCEDLEFGVWNIMQENIYPVNAGGEKKKIEQDFIKQLNDPFSVQEIPRVVVNLAKDVTDYREAINTLPQNFGEKWSDEKHLDLFPGDLVLLTNNNNEAAMVFEFDMDDGEKLVGLLVMDKDKMVLQEPTTIHNIKKVMTNNEQQKILKRFKKFTKENKDFEYTFFIVKHLQRHDDQWKQTAK